MKRTLTFKYDNKYIFCEGEEVILEINEETLELDIKALYDKLFKNLDTVPIIDFENVYVKTGESGKDNKAQRLFDTVTEIIATIISKLNSEKVFVNENEEVNGMVPF